MGRKGIYNNLTSDEKWANVSEENKELIDDFIIYKKSTNRSPKTTEQYLAILKIFFIWNAENNKNVFFINLRKKTIIKFMFYMASTLGYSSNRIATVKSVISSLGNYVENVIADEFPSFRNPMRGMESAAKTPIREKTILTEEIISKTLKSLTDDGLYQTACYLACAAASGARKAELLQFKLSSFTDENKVFNGCMWKTNSVRAKGKGAEGKVMQKFVFVSKFKPYLDLWLQAREKDKIDSEWLFVSEGHQASINNANCWCDTISRHMGVDFYSHACRHYWTTSLKNQGLPDDVVIALAGWAKKSGAAMVATYNDIEIEDTLCEYFDENGIKVVEK